MRIGLIADTHDRLPAVAELARRMAASGVSIVLHAGDYCSPFTLRPIADAGLVLLGVFGKNDGDREGLRAAAFAAGVGGELLEAPHRVDLDGRSVLLVHDVAEAGERSIDAHDVVIHGCTHHFEDTTVGGTRLVNPGEACGWLHGVPTAAILDLASLRVERLALDDDHWRE
jgi:putative phosphoesterase